MDRPKQVYKHYKSVESMDEDSRNEQTNKVNIEFLREQLDKALQELKKRRKGTGKLYHNNDRISFSSNDITTEIEEHGVKIVSKASVCKDSFKVKMVV